MIRIETTIGEQTIAVEGPDLAAAIGAYAAVANATAGDAVHVHQQRPPASSRDLDRLVAEHLAAERERIAAAVEALADEAAQPGSNPDFAYGYRACARSAAQLIRRLT